MVASTYTAAPELNLIRSIKRNVRNSESNYHYTYLHLQILHTYLYDNEVWVLLARDCRRTRMSIINEEAIDWLSHVYHLILSIHSWRTWCCLYFGKSRNYIFHLMFHFSHHISVYLIFSKLCFSLIISPPLISLNSFFWIFFKPIWWYVADLQHHVFTYIWKGTLFTWDFPLMSSMKYHLKHFFFENQMKFDSPKKASKLRPSIRITFPLISHKSILECTKAPLRGCLIFLP